MKRPIVADLERLLRDYYPEVDVFPLVRTLAAAASELGIPQKELLRKIPGGRKALWNYRGKTYVPPNVFEKCRGRNV